MQTAVTFTLAVAALFFSFACALLLEELLFGGLFRMFFARVETFGTNEKKPVQKSTN